MTVSTVESLFWRFVDGDVEEDVDFVRFMIGWQKSEAAEFFAFKLLSLTNPTNRATPLPWDCLVVPSTPTHKIKPSILTHDLDCLTVQYYRSNDQLYILKAYRLSDAGLKE